MAKKVALSNVQSSEIKEFQEICCHVYSINFGDHWNGNGLAIYLEKQFGTSQLLSDLENPQILYYFISHEKKNIGFLKVRIGGQISGINDHPLAEIEKMYLLPDFKGKGIGRDAMNQLLDILRVRDVTLVYLYVIATNNLAIAFYKKMHFRVYAKSRLDAPHFKDDLRGMYLMTRKLE